ncbi:MAG: VTT domain-containing protein [Acidobacteria bacterium]|nr:VTT domain-containing protein [Acidobacteriota bacterium]
MTPRSRGVAIRLVAALLLAAAIAGVYVSPLREWATIARAREAMEHLASLWYGPAVFILAFGIFGTLLVPATVFVVAASLIWGWAEGGTYAVLGGTLAAMSSYAIARWLGADTLHRFGDRGRVAALRLRNAGFRSLLILRLIPIFPFAALNYGSGFAGLRPRDVAFATLLGSAPSIFIISYSADAIARGTLSGEGAFRRLLIAGVLLAALALIPTLLRRRAAAAVEAVGD